VLTALATDHKSQTANCKFDIPPGASTQRLDHFLVAQLPDLSRVRVQELIAQGKVLVNGAAAKPSMKLRGGDSVAIAGTAERAPLRAIPEQIPLDVVYEDDDVAVVNKPAGMMVHAGAGATDDVRNLGTLVNALLHRFAALSGVGGELRPGIVHRLDRNTSGLIVVAKNDSAHRRLAEQFAAREVHKTYTALVQGWMTGDKGTINSAISRDAVRRTRMTTRRGNGRTAVSHWRVRERIDGPYGRFTWLDVQIETGRTHQIRVHLASAGHPVVGDTLYGAARQVKAASKEPLALARNFLHAASLEFSHPRTGKPLRLSAPLPVELEQFLAQLRP
jgi:23S rRNA pseudouridine1911/1915/1917 synthase